MKTKLILATIAALSTTVVLAGGKLKEADTDGDGYISQDEFNASHVVGMAERFSRIDTNADGLLSKEELDVAHEKRHASHHGDMKRKFDRGMKPQKMIERLDTDGSGGLSMIEIENGRRSPDLETFQAADVDSNGELDATELTAMMKARHAEHRASRRTRDSNKD